MRNYIKPEVNVKKYDLNTTIANSVSFNGTMGHLDEYDNNAGSMDWTNLFD